MTLTNMHAFELYDLSYTILCGTFFLHCGVRLYLHGLKWNMMSYSKVIQQYFTVYKCIPVNCPIVFQAMQPFTYLKQTRECTVIAHILCVCVCKYNKIVLSEYSK